MKAPETLEADYKDVLQAPSVKDQHAENPFFTTLHPVDLALVLAHCFDVQVLSPSLFSLFRFSICLSLSLKLFFLLSHSHLRFSFSLLFLFTFCSNCLFVCLFFLKYSLRLSVSFFFVSFFSLFLGAQSPRSAHVRGDGPVHGEGAEGRRG